MKIIDVTHGEFNPYKTILLQQSSDISPFYQPINVQYYQDYFERTDDDLSFIIELGKAGLLLLLVSKPINGVCDYFGLPVKLVWQPGLTIKQQKGALKVAYKQLDKIISEHQDIIRYEETLNGQVSAFCRRLLSKQALPSTQYQQVIDLTRPEDELLSDIRKIYRANVRWGEANMTYRLLSAKNIKPNEIEAFRQLHIEVAGKETRSANSWALQQQMIECGEGFAIYGYLEERLVATGLFVCNQHICYYGVGAYARDLFDKSISHALVWRGILQAKTLGCSQMMMGDAHFGQIAKPDGNFPADKDLNISHFKQGFGGELVAVLCF
jgi:lipid II:glycine glycyltransferase (peptidoglycan interpeptide bridge formation enzyme)